MAQYISKSAVVAEIERRIKEHHSGYLVCLKDILSFLDTLEVKEVEEPSKDLEEAAKDYSNNLDSIYGSIGEQTRKAFEAGAEWQKVNLWKDAQGNDLPKIDREVVALLNNSKVVYAHRPNPDGWDGKNILTGKVRHYDVQTYDKGEWNIPDVKWWLDLELPKNRE